MNKTIIININSIVFHIEEDAYEMLRSYMIDIKRHFGRSEESKEILEDIENRIAEMFSERIHSGRKEVIGVEDVNQVIGQMGRVSDFEAGILGDDEAESSGFGGEAVEESEPRKHFEEEEAEPKATAGSASYFAKKLMRDPDDKILGGVASGLGHYFGIESKWVRVIFLSFFLLGGSGAMLYIVLWLVMPQAGSRADRMAMRGEAPNLENFKKSYEKELEDYPGQQSTSRSDGERVVRNVESVIGGIFRMIGRILGVFTLIILGMNLLGLFIFFVFNALNLMGYENPIMFPPLMLIDPVDSYPALLAGFFGMIIPFVAFFYWMLRLLFRAPKMNNYASLTMLTIWGLSIVAIIYFCISASQNFRETSTVKVDKQLQSFKTYVLSERDVRVIDASSEDFDNGRINAIEDGLSLRDDLSISIEPLDSLEKPFVQYHYAAKGKTFKQASDNASDILYKITQNSENLVFDSHFLFSPEKQVYRDQRVDIKLFFPVGTKVTVMNNLDYKVRGSISIRDCYPDINNKSTEWVMTKNGLKCATTPPPSEEEKNDEESVTSEG
ncbi:PspC domain-containing protein [Sphingobacterium corticis]|uniref:PspC domain-containing protein n=1 Tax=Sphingobacterium corticis TaxID=1812823 RepID=A0ABW5NI41_9SPHI